MDLLIIADQCSARSLWVSIPVFGGLAPGENCFGREEAYQIMFQSLSLVNSRRSSGRGWTALAFFYQGKAKGGVIGVCRR